MLLEHSSECCRSLNFVRILTDPAKIRTTYADTIKAPSVDCMFDTIYDHPVTTEGTFNHLMWTTPPQPNTQRLVALPATIAILGPSQPSKEGFIFY